MAAFQQAIGRGINIHPFGPVFHGFQYLQPLSQRSRKGIHQPYFPFREFLPQCGGGHLGGSIAAADAAGHPHKQDIPSLPQQWGKTVNIPLRLHQRGGHIGSGPNHIIVGVPIKLLQAGHPVLLPIIIEGKGDQFHPQFLQQGAI